MEIIDAVGGVDVPLTTGEINYLKHWSVPAGSTEPVLNRPGNYHLNGFATVIYMRIRRTRASSDAETDIHDIGRTYRVRLVLSHIADKISGYSLAEAQNLLAGILRIWEEPFDRAYTYPGIRNNNIFRFNPPAQDTAARKRSDTNITFAEALDAMGVAFALRGSQVEQCRLPFDGTFHYYEYAKSDCQLMDFEANRALLHDFMFPESFIVSE